jgi:RNA polymerase sigma-70 factor (ECF subfamily)
MTGPSVAGEDGAGDFDALFAAHYAELLRYAVRRVGPDAAPDVVADVFLVAWRRRELLPHVAVRPWLFGIAAKAVLNQQRAAARQISLRDKLVALTPEPVDGRHDTGASSARVRAALARLRPAEQELLRLVEWDQLSVDEAAAALGCSAGALRVRLHRARRHFAAQLGHIAPAGHDMIEEVQSGAERD